MPSAARAFDTAQPGQGGDRSEATAGSPDVIIDNRAALRVGDGGQGFHTTDGSAGVFIDGLPAVRLGDPTDHEGTQGEVLQGSPDVIVGSHAGVPRPRPHDTSVALQVTDALGRPVHGVTVRASCPHEQRPAETVDGGTTVGGLCSGAAVSVAKSLQSGTWDAGASHGAHPQTTAREAKIVHAPAPSTTSTGGVSVTLPRANGPTLVVLPTTHNWVELVYEAFGQHLPTGPKDLALLGVRGASLAPAVPAEKKPEGTLEAEAAAGELADVDFTREAHTQTGYGDLLFCVWTDKSVHHAQHVDVFECDIDASPGRGTLHLPFLLEGKLFHATPGPYGSYPGHDVCLHVFTGAHEPKPPKEPTAEDVIALASTQKGITEWPPGSNLVKYGAWYGDNAQPWCAMFVSWCFSHAGMPLIHYAYCPYGAAYFQSGEYGTWHPYTSHAEPGDVVFYQFNGPSDAPTQAERNAVMDHTGIVVQDDGSYITTLEGNTSAPGSSGSQSNGGGVFLKTRTKDGTILGFGRPRYPKPVTLPTSFIRWGSEAATHRSAASAGSTILHHHYFHSEHKKQVVDPQATRYRRFKSLYDQAKNKGAIPYLVVSSRYVETYSEWAPGLSETPTAKPSPASVLRRSGLVSARWGHPSAATCRRSSARRTPRRGPLKHAAAMHDKEAPPAALRDALLGSLPRCPVSCAPRRRRPRRGSRRGTSGRGAASPVPSRTGTRPCCAWPRHPLLPARFSAWTAPLFPRRGPPGPPAQDLRRLRPRRCRRRLRRSRGERRRRRRGARGLGAGGNGTTSSASTSQACFSWSSSMGACPDTSQAPMYLGGQLTGCNQVVAGPRSPAAGRLLLLDRADPLAAALGPPVPPGRAAGHRGPAEDGGATPAPGRPGARGRASTGWPPRSGAASPRRGRPTGSWSTPRSPPSAASPSSSSPWARPPIWWPTRTAPRSTRSSTRGSAWRWPRRTPAGRSRPPPSPSPARWR